MTRDMRDMHLGEVVKQASGHRAEIVEYRDSKDIDVKFEDGTVKHGMSYAAFKAGKLNATFEDGRLVTD